MLVGDMTPEWITLAPQIDPRGQLVAIEGERDIPFTIKRIYTLQSLSLGAVRGGHAHQKLCQVVVCLVGSCRIDLDDGRSTARLSLNDATLALLLKPLVWHTLRDFSSDCVLLVLASDHYDERDYLRDYGDFSRQAQTFSLEPDTLPRP